MNKNPIFGDLRSFFIQANTTLKDTFLSVLVCALFIAIS